MSLQELKRKGQKMSKLKHKNLITVHGVIHDTADISKYIVTEVVRVALHLLLVGCLW